jgi:hypothetical protein
MAAPSPAGNLVKKGVLAAGCLVAVVAATIAVVAVSFFIGKPILQLTEDRRPASLDPKPGAIHGRAYSYDTGKTIDAFSIEYARTSDPEAVREVAGKNGVYEISIGDSDATDWNLRGRIDVPYAGRPYRLYLREVRRDKGVLDFAFEPGSTITGSRPAGSLKTQSFVAGHYGGLVTIDMHSALESKNGTTTLEPLHQTHHDKSTVEVILTPRGPRLDGAAGTEIRFNRYVLSSTSESSNMRGVPIGAYSATATITPPGGPPQPLRISDVPFEMIDAQNSRFPGRTPFEFHIRPIDGSVCMGETLTLYLNE